MKQLSNTPEAAAFVTGLYGNALRNHMMCVFGEVNRAQGRRRRNIPAPQYARALLQELAR